MRITHDRSDVERQIVHANFTVRWTRGCVLTRLHGGCPDDTEGRTIIGQCAIVLTEAIRSAGPRWVSVLDMRGYGEVPQPLWLDLARLVHGLPSRPLHRAVILAEGGVGDSQAQTSQLITAGHARFFSQLGDPAMLAWLTGGGTIDAPRLQRLCC